MKLVKHRRTPIGYKLEVHLDERRTKDDQPDPEWVHELTWGSQPPAGLSRKDYEEMQVREATLLAEEELAQRLAAHTDEGTVLASEGKKLK